MDTRKGVSRGRLTALGLASLAIILCLAVSGCGRHVGPKTLLEFRAQTAGRLDFSSATLNQATEDTRTDLYAKLVASLSPGTDPAKLVKSVDFDGEGFTVWTHAADPAEVTKQQDAIRRSLASLLPDLRARGASLVAPSPAGMAQLKDTITRRLDAMGVTPEVTLTAPDRVRVTVTSARDPQALQDLVGATGLLEFRCLPKKYAFGPAHAPVPENAGGYSFRETATAETPVPADRVLAVSPILITGRDLKPDSARVVASAGNPTAVTFEFREPASDVLRHFTMEHVNRYLAIVLDGKLVMAPIIYAAISDRGIIQGGFDSEGGMKRANELKIMLNAGPLPYDLELVQKEWNRAIP